MENKKPAFKIQDVDVTGFGGLPKILRKFERKPKNETRKEATFGCSCDYECDCNKECKCENYCSCDSECNKHCSCVGDCPCVNNYSRCFLDKCSCDGHCSCDSECGCDNGY